MSFTWQSERQTLAGVGLSMNKSQAYRANAADCAKLAMAVSDPESKLVLAKMAEAWLRLADYLDAHQPDTITDPTTPRD